jgi:LuxR family maltose regulon positive regulatory protein
MLTMAAGSPVVAQAHSGMGSLLYEWNDLGAAERQISQAIELGRRWGNVEALSGDYVWLARLRWARGDLAGMREALRRGSVLVEGDAYCMSRALISAVGAWLDLATGDLAAAQRWADASGLDGADDGLTMHEDEYLVLARILLERGEPEQASRLLERIWASAERSGRLGPSLRARIALAAAQQSQGEQALALATLRNALTAAEPGGYVRSIVDYGEPMRRLLTALEVEMAGQVAGGTSPLSVYVQKLLDTFNGGTSGLPADVPAQDGLPEPLSERELQVLRLVAAGHTNREIADELFIALSTVKSHTNAIYGKLGVRSRTQAIAAARDLGLL